MPDRSTRSHTPARVFDKAHAGSHQSLIVTTTHARHDRHALHHCTAYLLDGVHVQAVQLLVGRDVPAEGINNLPASQKLLIGYLIVGNFARPASAPRSMEAAPCSVRVLSKMPQKRHVNRNTASCRACLSPPPAGAAAKGVYPGGGPPLEEVGHEVQRLEVGQAQQVAVATAGTDAVRLRRGAHCAGSEPCGLHCSYDLLPRLAGHVAAAGLDAEALAPPGGLHSSTAACQAPCRL